MKSIRNYLFIFMCAIIVGSSCSKEDGEPYVVKSEIVNVGLDDKIDKKVENSNIKLSYTAWIDVDRDMKSRSATRVEQKLTTSFSVEEDTISVESFMFGDETPEIKFADSISELTQGDDHFVYLEDSIIKCTMKHDNFSYTYKITIQKALYDDLKSKQEFKFHDITKITPSKAIIKDLGFTTEEGYTVSRRLYSHSLSVTILDSVYHIPAEIVLEVYIPFIFETVVYRSELLDSGLGKVLNKGHYFSYDSWIKVKHYYTNGAVDEVTIRTQNNIRIDTYYFGDNWTAKILPDTNVSLLTYNFEEFPEDDKDDGGKIVKVVKRDGYDSSGGEYEDLPMNERYLNANFKNYLLSIQYSKNIAVHYKIISEMMIYGDYVSVFEMPSYKCFVDDVKSEIKFLFNEQWDEGLMARYVMIIEPIISCESEKLSRFGELSILVPIVY